MVDTKQTPVTVIPPAPQDAPLSIPPDGYIWEPIYIDSQGWQWMLTPWRGTGKQHGNDVLV